jgi:hypothetical protein
MAYLAKTTGPRTSIKSAYIVFFIKMQKRQNPKMRSALMIFENTISLKLYRALINCRTHKFLIEDFRAKL